MLPRRIASTSPTPTPPLTGRGFRSIKDGRTLALQLVDQIGLHRLRGFRGHLADRAANMRRQVRNRVVASAEYIMIEPDAPDFAFAGRKVADAHDRMRQ